MLSLFSNIIRLLCVFPKVPLDPMADINAAPIGRKYPEYIYPICREVVARKHGEPWWALWLTAISAQETGWGKSVRGVLGNNILGYHAVKGKPVITTTEAMTGNPQEYRYFDSFESCLISGHWLIKSSKHYKGPRKKYLKAKKKAQTPEEIRNVRTIFMGEFSRIYSEDPKHGIDTIRIFRTLEGWGFHADPGS